MMFHVKFMACNKNATKYHQMKNAIPGLECLDIGQNGKWRAMPQPTLIEELVNET